MQNLFLGVRVWRGGTFIRQDVILDDQGGTYRPFSGDPKNFDGRIISGRDIVVLPGLADVHVHLREPGFSYKETIHTGTLSAARGGYTVVCPMPNLNPVPDDLPTLQQQLDIIARDAVIHVVPYGAITRGQKGAELADMRAMAPYVCGFSDDGHGVQSGDQMYAGMCLAAELGLPIAAHCEENSLLFGGYIHDGVYASAHGHKGICDESEWVPIARDAVLTEHAGCAYHVCHVSTAESVEVIRRAKVRGVNITCETGPHYLVLCDQDLQEDGRFKMNPPLRGAEDRAALLEGLLDGTIDMIATDHAPHSAEEKAKGLAGSSMGVVGLETAFPVLYTELVRGGTITLEKLVDLMAGAPRRRFRLPLAENDFTVYDLSDTYTVDPAEFQTMGRATPFAGRTVSGRCLLTACGGRIAWLDSERWEVL